MTAGGRLKATANFTGGHASVCIYADAAMWFWPPKFVMELGFRATGKIGWFGFDVGCDIHLELPPLWGRVTVHFVGEGVFYFGTRKILEDFLHTLQTTEGNLDAETSWDSAAMSLGFQQWSMHVTDSAPALFARFKTLHPEAFDAVARASELDAGRGPNPQSAPGTAIADVLAESSFWRISPPGAQLLNPPGYKFPDIHRGLGWSNEGGKWIISPQTLRFSARWAVAARFVPAIWQAQAELAYEGIKRLYKALTGIGIATYAETWNPVTWRTAIDIAGIADLPQVDDNGTKRRPTVLELFRSEAAVASILDHSVNLPGDVAKALNRAMTIASAAHKAAHAADPKPLLVNDEFRWRLKIIHEGTRQQRATGGGTVDVALQRVPRVIRLFDLPGQISLTTDFLWP